MYDNSPTTFLNLHHFPARVDYQGASWILNFEIVGIRTLVELGYLKPLGNPKGSEHKYFSTRTLIKLADDEKWLGDATRALSKYWAERNKSRKKSQPVDCQVPNSKGPSPQSSVGD